MRDRCIRFAFHQQMLKKAHSCQNTIVVDELGLRNGAIRADIAVLNGKMVGYEIKTDSDTLVRLNAQMLAYNEVFDEVWVITGEKHLNKIVQLIPRWWGIYLIIERKRDDYAFKVVRRAKINKYKNGYSVARLLWKDEAINILTENDQAPKKALTKQDLYQLLTKQYSVNKLTQITLKYLKSREGWRTNQKALL